MRVFFLPRWFPHPDDPLWGLFVLRHAMAVQRFADVSVIYVDKRRDLKGIENPVVENIEGIPVLYWFYHESSIPLAGRIVTFVRMLSAWHQAWHMAVKQWGKPDINHVHILTRIGAVAFWLKRRFNIPYVITEHWSRYLPQNFYYRGWLRKAITRKVVEASGAVMPVTMDLASAMKSHGLIHDNYIVIPNVVDTALFKPSAKPKERRVLNFVHISTFDDRAKNISGMIRVFASLKKSGRDFRLKLIGDGADYLKVFRLAEELVLNPPTLEFTGAMDAQGVASELAGSDMLVMFSNYENMPVVINEALSCGIPVLATRVGGIPGVIHSRNGLLVDPGDEEALFSALATLMDEDFDTRFDSEGIRREAVEQFDLTSVGRRIFNIYNMVLNQ
ncbi:MAG: glycosyltransferase [Bacteroidales bacterium]